MSVEPYVTSIQSLKQFWFVNVHQCIILNSELYRAHIIKSHIATTIQNMFQPSHCKLPADQNSAPSLASSDVRHSSHHLPPEDASKLHLSIEHITCLYVSRSRHPLSPGQKSSPSWMARGFEEHQLPAWPEPEGNIRNIGFLAPKDVANWWHSGWKLPWGRSTNNSLSLRPASAPSTLPRSDLEPKTHSKAHRNGPGRWGSQGAGS